MSEYVSITEVIKAILNGALDDSHEEIKRVIKMRESVTNRTAAYSLNLGDRFFIKSVSPKYLEGALVEFVGYKDGAAPIRAKLVYSNRRYPAGFVLNLREGHVGEKRSL